MGANHVRFGFGAGDNNPAWWPIVFDVADEEIVRERTLPLLACGSDCQALRTTGAHGLGLHVACLFRRGGEPISAAQPTLSSDAGTVSHRMVLLLRCADRIIDQHTNTDSVQEIPSQRANHSIASPHHRGRRAFYHVGFCGSFDRELAALTTVLRPGGAESR
ncbi:MAG TPA: hypothetical protein VHV55_22545 [Pirellulales bacterium]|nr:hypothetical protein [Pirellulales bacterium]